MSKCAQCLVTGERVEVSQLETEILGERGELVTAEKPLLWLSKLLKEGFLCVTLLMEGMLACEKNIHDDAYGPDVDFFAVVLITALLWSHIEKGSNLVSHAMN